MPSGEGREVVVLWISCSAIALVWTLQNAQVTNSHIFLAEHQNGIKPLMLG